MACHLETEIYEGVQAIPGLGARLHQVKHAAVHAEKVSVTAQI